MSDHDRSGRKPSRRSVLRATVAATGAVGLAGCSINTDGGGVEVSFGGDDGTPADVTPVTPTTEAETETDSPTGTSTDYPDPAFDEDCLYQDPGDVEIEQDGDKWLLTDGKSRMLLFEEFETAKRARNVIQFYGFTHWCFVGRPDPPMQYWLVDGAAATRRAEDAVDAEDCIPFDRSKLKIEAFGDEDWRLVTDSQSVLALSSEENAQRALDVIEHYKFDSQCFVGRPNAPMQYWLTRSDR